MKITIRVVNFILIIVGIVLLSISSTGIFFGLATPGLYTEFPGAYVMLSIGVGLLIGASFGIYGESRSKGK